jgi:uncharacterized membrane protein
MPSPTRPRPSGASPATPGRNKKFPNAKIAVPGNKGVKVVWAVTVRKPADELYAFWENPENLMRVTKHPVTIRRLSQDESSWSVPAPPGNRRVEWVSIVFSREPNQLIAWRSRDGADIRNAGTVRFEAAPGDEGIEVTVQIEYEPPFGKLGQKVAKLWGEEGGQQVKEALRRFKALLEAGEIPTTEGQSVGKPQANDKGRKGK